MVLAAGGRSRVVSRVLCWEGEGGMKKWAGNNDFWDGLRVGSREEVRIGGFMRSWVKLGGICVDVKSGDWYTLIFFASSSTPPRSLSRSLISTDMQVPNAYPTHGL